jgi:hypothetical protein
MQPGHQMTITVETADYSPTTAEVVCKGKGEMDGQSTVSAKFTVARYTLRDRDPTLAAVDQRIIEELRKRGHQL